MEESTHTLVKSRPRSVPTRKRTGTEPSGGATLGPKLFLVFLAASVVLPFVWMLLASFKTHAENLTFPPTFFPQDWTLSQYSEAWNSIPLLLFGRNTLIFAGGATLLSVAFDTMAGYAFARYNFPGKKQLFIAILLVMMIPYQVIMIPLFMEISSLGMLNTFVGLILPRAASAFGIYLMRSFLVSLPKELEEAARLDGLNEFSIFFRIMLPLCIPALVMLSITHFMNSWNDLLYPLVMTSGADMRTLPAGLAVFVGERTIEIGPALAATTISLVPLIVVFLFAQRYFIRGIATTGIRG